MARRSVVWLIVSQGTTVLADGAMWAHLYIYLSPIISLCFFLSLWIGWLVGCFGLNGPLRQYFSLYRAASQREGERKRTDR